MIKGLFNEGVYYLRVNFHYIIIFIIAVTTGFLVSSASLIEQDKVLVELRKEALGKLALYYEFEDYETERQTLRAAYHRLPLEKRERLKDDYKRYILRPDTID